MKISSDKNNGQKKFKKILIYFSGWKPECRRASTLKLRLLVIMKISQFVLSLEWTTECQFPQHRRQAAFFIVKISLKLSVDLLRRSRLPTQDLFIYQFIIKVLFEILKREVGFFHRRNPPINFLVRLVKYQSIVKKSR